MGEGCGHGQAQRGWRETGDAGADGPLPTAGGGRPAQARGRNPKKSDGVFRAGSAVKYAWIDLHRQTFALAEMCALPVVSISSYRAWKHGGKADRQWLTDAQRLALIRAIHVQHKVAYGS